MKTYRLKVDGLNLGVYTMSEETEHKFRYFPDLQMIPVKPTTDREKQERTFNSIMEELVTILNNRAKRRDERRDENENL